ncbi:MAG: type II toxin-antitoxin system prevent-host-death family antitoxin [Candidatus Binatia bacterium]
MSAIDIRELKNRLTHTFGGTKRGEEVIVTERGRPIAVIRPIKSADKAVSLKANVAILAAQGVLSLPTRKPLRRAVCQKRQANRALRLLCKIGGDHHQTGHSQITIGFLLILIRLPESVYFPVYT